MGIPTVSEISSGPSELSRQSSLGSLSGSPLRNTSGSGLSSSTSGSTHGQVSNNYSPIFLQVYWLIHAGYSSNLFHDVHAINTAKILTLIAFCWIQWSPVSVLYLSVAQLLVEIRWIFLQISLALLPLYAFDKPDIFM